MPSNFDDREGRTVEESHRGHSSEIDSVIVAWN